MVLGPAQLPFTKGISLHNTPHMRCHRFLATGFGQNPSQSTRLPPAKKWARAVVTGRNVEPVSSRTTCCGYLAPDELPGGDRGPICGRGDRWRRRRRIGDHVWSFSTSTIASPSSTVNPSWFRQTVANRTRRFATSISRTDTDAVTVSPIRTGAVNRKVCER